MTSPCAFLNGKILSQADVAVSPTDTGFVLGATVSEQLRTFRGSVFRLADHLSRFARSLELVGLADAVSLDEVRQAVDQVVAHNHPLAVTEQSCDTDLGVTIFATPGPYASYRSTAESSGPTVCVHTFPLPFRLWADKYGTGQPLRTTGVAQVSPRCWPREMKCRSRMHYYLADQQAAHSEPGARALLLDEAGFVNETSTANIVAVCGDNTLVSPPETDVLHGISMAEVRELADRMGLGWTARPLLLDELAAADELLLTSTPYCLLPCCRLNGQPIGSGAPGPVYARLLAAWSNEVGLDIAEQAQRCTH